MRTPFASPEEAAERPEEIAGQVAVRSGASARSDDLPTTPGARIWVRYMILRTEPP